MSRAVLRQLHDRRGFTLIEVMLVCALIGILSTLAIPVFQRFAARAQKAELHNVLGKMELAFRNNYQATGTYGTFVQGGTSLDLDAEWNPPQPPGEAATWNLNSPSYATFPFPPDGPLHLRYKYTVSNGGKTLTLQAQGSFIGIPDWTYTQTFQDGAAPLPPTEVPNL